MITTLDPMETDVIVQSAKAPEAMFETDELMEITPLQQALEGSVPETQSSVIGVTVELAVGLAVRVAVGVAVGEGVTITRMQDCTALEYTLGAREEGTYIVFVETPHGGLLYNESPKA